MHICMYVYIYIFIRILTLHVWRVQERQPPVYKRTRTALDPAVATQQCHHLAQVAIDGVFSKSADCNFQLVFGCSKAGS